MENLRYELFLNRLSLAEHFDFREEFQEYAQAVILMLDLKQKFSFEDDLLKKHKANSIDELISQSVNRFLHTGSSRRKNEKNIEEPFIRIWYDLYSDVYIEPEDFYYDVFFAYRLRQLDVLMIDEFLDYQMEKWGEEKKEKFLRFLNLTIRKYESKFLQPVTILTAIEWIKKQEKQLSLSGYEESEVIKVKTKGKYKRMANDGQTSLSQPQTALFIHYSKMANIFRDENNLSDTEAGIAFTVLTGYSSVAMRQALGEKGISDIATKENLKELFSVLKKLIDLVSKDLKKN